jgi:hypothetical protein
VRFPNESRPSALNARDADGYAEIENSEQDDNREIRSAVLAIPE